MKKSYLIIAIVIIIAIGTGLAFFLFSKKECQDLNEKQCKKDDRCLSVLVPCQGSDCAAKTVFKECKDKVK